MKTNWLERFKGAIVFGQARGQFLPPYKHEKYGGTCFGELYWEIRNYNPEYIQDMEYTKYICKFLRSKGGNNLHFVGYNVEVYLVCY